jgi:hypothetical protein
MLVMGWASDGLFYGLAALKRSRESDCLFVLAVADFRSTDLEHLYLMGHYWVEILQHDCFAFPLSNADAEAMNKFLSDTALCLAYGD